MLGRNLETAFAFTFFAVTEISSAYISPVEIFGVHHISRSRQRSNDDTLRALLRARGDPRGFPR